MDPHCCFTVLGFGVLHPHGVGFRHGGYGRMPEGAGPGRLRLRHQQAGRAGGLMFTLFFFPEACGVNDWQHSERMNGIQRLFSFGLIV